MIFSVRFKTKLSVVFIVSCLFSQPLFAAEAGPAGVRVGGFFSTAATKTDQQTPYINGSDYTENTDYFSGTTVGIHVNFNVSEAFKFTTQMIGRGHEGGYETSFEWLFATYTLQENISIRAGRLRFPNYLISKTLDVGLTYPWVRPPVEVYDTSFSFFSKYNGIDMLISVPIGDADLLIQPYFGQIKTELNSVLAGDGAQVDTDSLYGISVELALGALNWRASILATDAHMTSSSGIAIGLRTEITSLGVKYNGDDFFVMSELTKMSIGSANYDFTGISTTAAAQSTALATLKSVGSTIANAPTTTGVYITVGKSIDSITPYITYGKVYSTGGDLSHPVLGSSMTVFRQEQHSITFGVRYDIESNVAVKAEYHSATVEGGSRGVYVVVPPAGEEDINVMSVSLDMVF